MTASSRVSVWGDGSRPSPLTPAAAHAGRRAEVAVVGAGLAGMLTATLLARAGVDVVVIDRAAVGGVATRNTTAKVSALQGTRCSSIRTHRGEEVVARYVAAQLDAVSGIRDLVGAMGVECDLMSSPAFTYATEPDAVVTLSEELDAAQAAGLPVRWTTTDTGLPYEVAGAIRLDDQLRIDPILLCRALADRLGPARVLQGTVTDVQEDGDGCSIRLDGDTGITAGHAVIATQGPIVDPAFLSNRCTPMQSYCIAARLPGPVPEGMYLSCDHASRSLRPARFDGETLAVVGGNGHHMGEEPAGPERWDVLEQWARDRLGAVEVTHRWATHDLVPTDQVPFIGRLAPGADRRFVATGFAKWGMSNAYVAARIITAAITGGAELPWAGAFDSTRIASTVNRELVSAGTTATKHLVGDRIARRPEPRCTHQGCVLRKDEALDTWDCPCHGSRFTVDGTVIQGPAVASLEL